MAKTKELSEEQLKAQIEAKRVEREKKLIDELNKWCEKNNCIVIPAVNIHIEGKPLGVVLKAL